MEQIVTIIIAMLSFWVGEQIYKKFNPKETAGTIFIEYREDGDPHIWLECRSMDAITSSGSEAKFKIVKYKYTRK